MQRADLFGNKSLPTSNKGFNPYGAGKKHYGAGRTMPNIGPVSNKQGYAERDNKAAARKAAMLRRLKASGKGNPVSKDLN
ncbi:hypothetical protein ACFY7C_36635 [Streptomyces sp. NPDC012769]|uniref:hypothetical protein n=1 Tax=Streptomyces sp. NPDC012769 TaxID=3364848 RepID=UPI00368304C8